MVDEEQQSVILMRKINIKILFQTKLNRFLFKIVSDF